MFVSKKLGIIAAIALAGLAQPAFAQATLHVFLWDAGPDVEMAAGHKMGDGGDPLTATMGMAISVSTVPAGKVIFDVTNNSVDTMHEMVVSKLPGPDAVLPYNADIARVDESAIGNAGEIEDLDFSQEGELSVILDPGTYALYCNIPGHYAAGMWTKITVQ